MTKSKPIAEPNYDVCLVTYLDILGFRHKLLQSVYTEIVELFHQARRILELCGLSVSAAANQPWRHTCQFQDSLVGVTKLWATTAQPEATVKSLLGTRASAVFAQEVENICNIQMNFIRRQVLIRGAIAIGAVTVIGESVLGPSHARTILNRPRRNIHV